MSNYTCATSTFIDTIPTSIDGELLSLKPNFNWYYIIPDGDGTVTVSTVQNDGVDAYSRANTVLDVYAGTCSNLIHLASNDNYTSTYSQINDIPVNLATTYYIRVSGSSTDIGKYKLTITGTVGSINNNPATAVSLLPNTNGQAPNLLFPQTYTLRIDGANSGVTITPSATGGGYFDPATLVLSSVTPANRKGAVTYHPDSEGTKVISFTNDKGLVNPANVTLNMLYPPAGLNGVLSWLRGDKTGTADGSQLSTWIDLTGFGFNAVQYNSSYQPTVTANVVNGNSVARFNSATKMSWGSTNIAFPYTIVAVFSRNSTTSQYQRAVQGSTNWLIGPYDGKIRNYANGWIAYNNSPTVTNGVFYRTLATNDGVTDRFYVNNTDYTEQTNNATTPGLLGLGVQGSQTNEPLLGDIAELILINHVLTVDERNALEGYFYGRFVYSSPAVNLSISGPANDPVGTQSRSFVLTTDGTISSPVTVTLSDNGAGGTFTPPTVTFNQYTLTGSFTYIPASVGAKSITITNNGGLNNPPPFTFTAYNLFPLINSSFENPYVGDNTFQYRPVEPTSPWVFNGNSGITSGGSFGFSNAPPDGKQAALIQTTTSLSNSSITQTFTTLRPGNVYTVKASLATRYNSTANPISCFFDNTQLGIPFTSTSTWTEVTFGSFQATSTTHTLKFAGTVTGNDWTTYIDKVVITFVESGPATSFFLTGNTGNWIVNTPANYTIAINGTVATSIVVTPAITGEVSIPSTVTLTNANPVSSFSCTPTTVGTKSITLTNNGGLTNPSPSSLIVRTARGNVPKDLLLWLANGGITAAASSTMQTWSDWSTSHRDAVQLTVANQPTVNQSGAKYLTFDGNGDMMTSPFSTDYNSAERTLFILVRINNISNNSSPYNRAFFSQDEGSGYYPKWIWSYGNSDGTGGQVFHQHDTLGNYGEVYSSTLWTRDTTKFYLLTMRRKSATYYFYKGGTSDGSPSNSVISPNPNADVTIGYAEVGTFSGDIAEVLYYNRALTDNEVLSIQRELATIGVPQSADSVIEPYELVNEPWDSYSTNADVRVNWTLSSTSDAQITPSTTQIYAGSKSLMMTAGNTAQKTLTYSHIYWTAKFRLYIDPSKLGGDGGTLFSIAAPGANVGNPIKTTHESDGTVKFYVGSNQVFQSSRKLITAGWHKIEFKIKLIPDNNTATVPSGVASASSEYSGGGQEAAKGFDGTTATTWTTNATSSGWLQYKFDNSQKITQYKVGCRSEYDVNTAPKNWTFLGSNDGSVWTTLDTRTNQTSWAFGEIRSFAITSPSFFFYYRLNVTANNGQTYLSVGELQFDLVCGSGQIRIDGLEYLTLPTGINVRSTADNYTLFTVGTGLQTSGAGIRYVDELRLDAGVTDYVDPPEFHQTDFSNPAYSGPAVYYPSYTTTASPKSGYSGPIAFFSYRQAAVNKSTAYSGLVTFWPSIPSTSKTGYSGVIPYFSVATPSSKIGYSGPTYIFKNPLPEPSSKAGYYGVVQVVFDTTKKPTSKIGYSGIVGPFAYYENGRYVWDLDFQFANVNGNIQRGNDQATLARVRFLPTDLNINNFNFYYRFDTTGLTNLNPTGSIYDATTYATSIDATGLSTGTTVVQTTTGTVTTTTTLTGNTTPDSGLTASSFVYLNTNSNITSFVVGGDIVLPSSSTTNKTLYGNYILRYPVSASGSTYDYSVFELYFDTSNNLYLQGMNGYSSTYSYYGNLYYPIAITGFVNNTLTNIIIKANLVASETVTGFTNPSTAPVVYFHLFINGKYVCKTRVPQRQYNTTGLVDWSMRGSYKPSIGSSSRNISQVTTTNPFGNPVFYYPFTGKVNNFFFANYDFDIPASCIPKYTADGYSNATATLNPSWTDGSDVLFSTVKPIDPAVEPASKFIIYTQVINAGIVRAFTKYLVDFTLPNPTAGQKVEVSYRVSNTSFAADDSSLSWSAWNDVTALNKTYVPITSTYGQYAQMQLRLTPDSTNHQAVPIVNETEFWLINGPNLTFDKFFMVL